MLLAIGSASLTAALVSCPREDGLKRLPEPALQVDQLRQRPTAMVDVLWVVDNSGTMLDEQVSLAENFEAFIQGLTVCQDTGVAQDLCDFATKTCALSKLPCNPPDYHIGVISTDTRSNSESGRLRRVGLCVESPGSAPASAKYRYCLGDSAECRHDPSNPDSDPKNAHCDLGQAIGFVTPTTPNARGAFDRAVRVGTSGSGNEQGLRAAAMALGRDTKATQNRNLDNPLCDGAAPGEFCRPPPENEGFLRGDASLFVIFVSDEEDNSFGEVSYFYRAFESLKGPGNEGRVSISAIAGDPDVDGAMGPLSGGCPVGADEPNADPSARYPALAIYSRGLSAELRGCDDLRLLCPDGTRCVRPISGLPGFCAPTESCERSEDCSAFACSLGPCFTCLGGACSIGETAFLELMAARGMFLSICGEDFRIMLDALGVDAAGLKKKFPLTRPVDCTERVRCCSDRDFDDTTCETYAALCVKVDGRVVPNDRSDGWIYERAGNAIFFDGRYGPQSNAEISIAYRVPVFDTRPVGCAGVLK